MTATAARVAVFPPGSKTPVCNLPPETVQYRCRCGSVRAFHRDAPVEEQAAHHGAAIAEVGGRRTFFCSARCREGTPREVPTPQTQSRCARCRCVTQHAVGTPPAGSIAVDQFAWFCSDACHRAATTPPAPPAPATLTEIEALEQTDPVKYREFVRRTLARAIEIVGTK